LPEDSRQRQRESRAETHRILVTPLHGKKEEKEKKKGTSLNGIKLSINSLRQQGFA